MLGCIADAEDAVHDTFLKWMTIDTTKITNTKAFLIRSVTNNCLNILSRNKRSPLQALSDEDLDPQVLELSEHVFDHDNRLGEAWKMINTKLGPVEKAIYVLREAFSVEYEDLQHIVDKSAANCRKLFSRAKEKVQEDLPKIHIDLPSPAVIPHTLKNAFKFGQLSELIAELKLEFPVLKKK